MYARSRGPDIHQRTAKDAASTTRHYWLSFHSLRNLVSSVLNSATTGSGQSVLVPAPGTWYHHRRLIPCLGARHMGLENRDYFRDGSYSESLADWGVDFTPVVKYLIIVNVVIFLLQIFITRA